MRFHTGLVGVQIMLEIVRQTKLIRAFALRLTDALLSEHFHGHVQCFCEPIHGYGGTLLQLRLSAANVIQRRVWDAGQRGKAIFRHMPLGNDGCTTNTVIHYYAIIRKAL